MCAVSTRSKANDVFYRTNNRAQCFVLGGRLAMLYSSSWDEWQQRREGGGSTGWKINPAIVLPYCYVLT